MWADVDVDTDFLNYSEVASLVVNVLKNPAMRPVSVGVFGRWGTGKSTILNLIEKGLRETPPEGKLIVIRFDAWLYQGFDDSRTALMEVIAAQLWEASKASDTLSKKAKRLWGRVNHLRLLGLAAEVGALAAGVPTFGVLSKGIEAVGTAVSGKADDDDVQAIRDAAADAKSRVAGVVPPEEQRTAPKEIDAFRREFGELLNELKATLVVFVDNLDRCLPKQTIHTLEALRLFLFMKRTAFIIAADEDMVRHSVSEHFRDPGGDHVTDYLDKLIQVPVRVPRLGVQEVRAYMFLLFASASGEVPPAKLEKLRKGLEDNLRSSWKDEPLTVEAALKLLGNNQPKEIVRAFGIADRVAPLLAHSTLVGGNPRIVKRMMNVVRMRSELAIARRMPVDESLVAKVALFERCMDSPAVSHLYEAINAAAEGKPTLLKELHGLIESPDAFKTACPPAWQGNADFLRDWLGLEPLLGDIDLRPLVYLSRETVPLRISAGGLSAPAQSAVQVLMRATSSSSPSGKSAAANIPAGERPAVMAALIKVLRTHTDWTVRPAGFDGCVILADASVEAARAFDSFLRSTMGSMPPWLSMAVKTKTWFGGGGGKS